MCVVEDARFLLPSVGACIRFKKEFDQCTLGKRRLKVNEFASEVPISHWNEMREENVLL
jgi:hypothetical protein